VQVNGQDLLQVYTRRDLQEGSFLVEGQRTVAAFALPTGTTNLHLTAA